MSRIVDLTVTLKLELADRLGRTEFVNDLEPMLRSGLGDVLTPYSDSVNIVAVNDPNGTLSQPMNLAAVLDPFCQAAIVWSAHDVLDVRPDLTLEQASEVLHHVIRQHDANHGIGWHDFEDFAGTLFGELPSDSMPSENTP
jgi:hypothetical protein